MGFDIECIIDIHTYPGEYFCPVCRTLVYPNEALQSQCTHLYCKPCLAHVANNTRACPYDGYLVTEPDSKPLLESDKTLAENIGKVKVRCLYHRSGCTWEGPLSDCTSHCSGCTFGNSPVICNRCSIQIVHRQVHDHQQSCLGVHQVQQAADATQNATSSGPTVATTGVSQNQPTIQSGAPSSQVQNSQNAPGPMLPVQDSNQQTNASSQAPAAVPAAPTPTPTPEQLYQQQYQQYYQHYAGYTHYQQAYQQYYPYQQSSVQQLQQQPVAHGGQPQLQIYSQAQMQSQPQSQVQPMPHSQSQPQQLIQSLAQPVQTQTGQPQTQVQQGHSHPIPHVQAVQTQNHPQVTPQQQVHPTMQPHAQAQSQFNLPHGFTAPQSQAHLMQPQPQHAQVLQYQQHLQPSQVQLQPHLPQAQLQTQPHSQLQQPPHLQHHTPHPPQMRPLQSHQPTVHAQPLHSISNAVTGHHSYPQAQLLQQAQLGVPQQYPVHAHQTSGSFAPGQLQGQIPQQPTPLVPPSAHGQIPTQLTSFTSQSQVPSMPPAHQQQFHPQAPQQNHSIQQRPVVHSAQQSVPQQYPQQQPIPGPLPGQLHQQGHLATQQPVQSQLRPQGPPPMMHPNPQSHLHVQQNVPMLPGLQSQQTHNHGGRPLIHGTQGQPMPSLPQTSGGFASIPQPSSAQLGSNQPSLTQNFVHTVNNQLHTPSDMQFVQSGVTQRQGDHVIKTPVGQEAGLPSQNTVEKVGNAPRPDLDGLKTVKSEVGMSYEQEQNDRTRLKESHSMGAGSEPHDSHDEELESHNSKKTLLQKTGNESLQAIRDVSLPSGSKADGLKNVIPEGSHQTSISASDQLQLYSHEQHMHHYGPSTNHLKPGCPPVLARSEVPVHPPAQVKPQGPVLLPHPRNPMNPSDRLQPPLLKQPPDVPLGAVPPPGSVPSFEGGPGYFNASCAPPSVAVDRRDGIIGRAPQHGSEGQFGSPHFVNPVEADIIQSQKLNPFDGGQSRLLGSYGRGPSGPSLNGKPSSFRMDGGPGYDSSIRSHDEKFKTLPADNLKPFSTPWPVDQGGPPPRVLHPFHPPGDVRFTDAGERGKLEHDHTRPNLTGPGRDYLGRLPHGSSGGLHCRDDIDGREVRSFGEGSRSYNMPSDSVGNSFHENRFPPFPSFQRRGGFDGREHVPPGPHNNLRRGDMFRHDTPPSHFRRGELAPGNSPGHPRLGDPTTFGPFPGQTRVGELPAPGNLPYNTCFGDSFLGSKTSLPRLGEPGFRSSFSPGFPNDGPYGVDPLDNARKRKPVSMGWCRICKVDCDTVEGLDMHSQSRGHQNMALDMVMSIKQQNKKKHRVSSDHAVREETNKTRNTGMEDRGNKP